MGGLSSLILLFIACQTENPDSKSVTKNLYFPPTLGPDWEAVNPVLCYPVPKYKLWEHFLLVPLGTWSVDWEDALSICVLFFPIKWC